MKNFYYLYIFCVLMSWPIAGRAQSAQTDRLSNPADFGNSHQSIKVDQELKNRDYSKNHTLEKALQRSVDRWKKSSDESSKSSSNSEGGSNKGSSTSTNSRNNQTNGKSANSKKENEKCDKCSISASELRKFKK